MNVDNLEDIYELSPMQQGMLFHTLYAPTSGVYCEQMYCALHGELNSAAFQRSWQRVVQQHPILRTAVYWDDLETPLQIVQRHVELPWQFLDWQGFSQDEQQDQLQHYLQEDGTRGFDFAQAPLMRFALIQTAEDTYYFIWSYHHLLLDGWSLFLVLGEVFTCYDAYIQEQDPYLAYRHPYKDYIAWLQQQDLQQVERFWRRILSGFQQATPPGIDQAARSSIQPTYLKQHLSLSREMTEELRAFARQHQLTLSTIIQGAWTLLLSRYSGQEDVVVGTTVSGRPAALPGVEAMIGLFINTLPLRVQVSANSLLIPWLQQIQALHAEMRQYEYSPLVQIQGWSDIPRGTPLFESIVVFENFPARPAPQQNGKLKVGTLQAIEQTNYPLSVLVAPLHELLIQIYYDSQRFTADAIERLLNHLQNILASMLRQPQQCLGTISLFSAAEYKQMTGNWQITREASDTGQQCLHHRFEQQAERTPDAIALVYGEHALTYQELNRRANHVAHHLRRLGIGPEVLVGVYMERSLELIISLLAIAKAGGASLPLDPQYPSARIATILNDSAARIVLTQQRLQPALTPIFPHVVCLETLSKNNTDNANNPPSRQLQAENLAYVIYTSGSTGKPKGVAITHSSAVTMLTWALHSFTPEQYRGTLAATSICFDLSVFEIWLPLSGGGTILLANDLLQLPSLPLAQAVTLINTVPSVLAELLRQETLPETVRTVNLAGEALPASLVQHLYSLPSIQQVYNLYGPTEDTTYSTWELALPNPGKSVPIGKPIDQTRAYVLDERMQPVPPDIPGDLYLGGAGLARGYIQQPDLTAERFLPDPFGREPGQRLYRTGDLVVYRSNGKLEFLGRKDEQVKLRGYRIEPGEIEAALNRHPDVQQCAVVMRADRSGEQSLMAYVVPNPGKELLVSDLCTTLQRQLPRYMLPSIFISLAALPRTISGKLDRRALPPPDHLQLEPVVPYRAPQTELERTIASTWQEVLQREKVGVHDNFFDLGGHSLHLIRVQSTLQTALNRDIPLMALFKYPTVSALANHLSQPQEDEETPSYQSIYDRAETRRTSIQRQRQQRQRRTTYHQAAEEEEQP